MTYGIVVELDTGALLFYGIPFIIVVGWFSSRLLGVHRGWGRSFVAGFFGWVFGVSIAAFIENENIRNTHQLNHVLLLALFFGVLISMFVGLILDVILKPQVAKHHRFRWLLHPIATAKRKLAPLGRSREILRYARKRGLTHYAVGVEVGDARVRPPPAPHARGLRRDVRQVRTDRVDPHRPPPRGAHHRARDAAVDRRARSRPTRSGRSSRPSSVPPVEEEFASFDFEPFAAASIGQTHRAVLKTGERVVVKVQRPGIEDIVHRDAAVLRLAASSTGGWRRRGSSASSASPRSSSPRWSAELDYGAEASSGVAFLGHLEGKEGIAAPIVYQSLSTRRVLVMEEIDGVTVADHGAVEAASPSADVLATRLLQSFLDQVLRDGLYHADPHPGNIFVDRERHALVPRLRRGGAPQPDRPRIAPGDGDRLPAQRPRGAGTGQRPSRRGRRGR